MRNLVRVQIFLLSALLVLLSACGGGGGGGSTTPPPLNNPTPAISSLSPSTILAGSSATTLNINGTGFMSSSTVQWAGSSRSVTFVSSTQLQVAVSVADLAAAGSVTVIVTNPSPGGGVSNNATIAINNPAPAITSVSPNTATAGQDTATVTVTGTGFVAASVINVNGAARTTTFISGTQLQVSLPASDFMTAGSLQISVSNGAPGGGTSPASPIAISNPVPTISGVSPNTLPQGSSDIAVDITGTGFVRASIAQFNGSSRATQYVSSTQLRATLTYSDFSLSQTGKITVTNAAPGGGTSGSVDFVVSNALPGTLTLIPASLPAGAQSTQIIVQGTGFSLGSIVRWNGAPRPTTFLDTATLRVYLYSTDLASPGTGQITVYNPPPGGGTSQPATFTIVPMGVTYVWPDQFYVGSPDMQINIYGGGFVSGAVVQWNGVALATSYTNSNQLTATIPSTNLSALSSANLIVVNPDNSTSAPILIDVIANPVPTLSSVYPNYAPVGSGTTNLSLYGSGFTSASVVKLNGVALPVTSLPQNETSSLGATITPSMMLRFGTYPITVTNPGPGGGGTSASLPFTTYLALANNDLVYSSWSKKLYASIPSTGGSLGNCIVEIDPLTGNVTRSVYVGSEPKKLALSSDGRTLWVGLDGASAVRKVDLTTTTMTAGLQFSVGQPSNNYSAVYGAYDVAVMPGSPDTIAVSSVNGITIYDSGVARSKVATSYGNAFIAFDSTGGKLYTMGGSYSYAILTIDATGVSASAPINISGYTNGLRYDNGRVYLSNGTTLNADTGALIATFYLSGSQVATGPVTPDSANGKVFILTSNYGSNAQVMAFNSNTFVSAGSIGVSGLDIYGASALLRWGQNGIAFRTNSQIYILQSDVIKDMSASPADVGVTVTAPSGATTGAALVYTATVTNHGTSAADAVTLFDALPAGVTPVSASAPQGLCSAGKVVRCNLDSITSGASVQVTLQVKPLSAGTYTDSISVSAIQPDPDLSNNSAAASVAITGSTYNDAPTISSISPSAAKAGSSTFTLTVSGDGFSPTSSILWNGTALPTVFVDGQTLTASIDATQIASLGYAWVNVSSPGPGGGISASLPFTIYQAISLDANNIIFEPFRRKIYAAVSATATQVPGNSIVSIDPLVGTFGTPVNVGSQPHPMALSDDGNYLFVGLDGSNSLLRFNLTANTTDLSYQMGSTVYGAETVNGISVAVGNPNLLAIDTGIAGIGVFDISGTTIAQRGNLTGVYTGSNPVFTDSTHFYAGASSFFRYAVTPSGPSLLDQWSLNGFSGSPSFILSKGIAYGANGGVADPSTTPPMMLGKFGASAPFVPDGYIGRAFFVGCNGYCPTNNSVAAYDQNTYRLAATVPINLNGEYHDLIRWGKDGIAFRTQTDFWGNGTGQIILLRGPFVLPQLGVSNPIATASSVSPSSASAGSGNLYVKITGSGFIPGAVARWNGAERTTYFIDTTHLQVAIPASDLTGAGSGSLTVLNPGAAAASAAVTFTIN